MAVQRRSAVHLVLKSQQSTAGVLVARTPAGERPERLAGLLFTDDGGKVSYTAVGHPSIVEKEQKVTMGKV